jgi:hypothetical protein
MAVGGKNGAHGLSPLPCYRIGSWRRSVGGGFGQFGQLGFVLLNPQHLVRRTGNVPSFPSGQLGLANLGLPRYFRLGNTAHPQPLDDLSNFIHAAIVCISA